MRQAPREEGAQVRLPEQVLPCQVFLEQVLPCQAFLEQALPFRNAEPVSQIDQNVVRSDLRPSLVQQWGSPLSIATALLPAH